MRTSDDPSPPDTAEAVIAALTEGFDDFSPQIQRAARFVIDHPREVGVQSMRALAVKADLHPNTLVRLAQALGFDGFDALRERFRHFMVSGGIGGFGDRARWLREMAAEGGTAEVVAEMAEATGGNLDTLWRGLDRAALDAMADGIVAARRVLVLGVGSAYALALQFGYVARMAFDHVTLIPGQGSQPLDDLAHVGSGDLLLAFTFQPYRTETMQAARAARAAGCPVFGVSDSGTSPLARVCERVLIAPTHTPQFFQSHVAATAVLEVLLAVLVSRADDAAQSRIEAFHRARLEAGLYEEDEPLARLGWESAS